MEKSHFRWTTFRGAGQFPIDGECWSYSVGDKFIATWRDKGTKLFVRTPGGPWQPLRVSLPATEMSTEQANYRFVSDTTLAARTSYFSQSFSVLSIQGKILLTQTLPKGRVWGDIITSHGGQYFGVIEARFRGLTNEFLDMYAYPSSDQFAVYNLSDCREIFRVKVEGDSPWYPKRLVQKYAISPDGKLAVVMTNGVIRAYAIR
jgi:hypothetical protein